MVVLDHKNDSVAVVVLGTDAAKIYGLSSRYIDNVTASAIKKALANKGLGESIEILKQDFPTVYKTAFRTYNIETPIIQEYELT